MFSHPLLVLLFLCANGVILFAIHTWLEDRREVRNAASEYARKTVAKHIVDGEYDRFTTTEEIDRDYKILYRYYLRTH